MLRGGARGRGEEVEVDGVGVRVITRRRPVTGAWALAIILADFEEQGLLSLGLGTVALFSGIAAYWSLKYGVEQMDTTGSLLEEADEYAATADNEQGLINRNPDAFEVAY